ncbi:glycosyltransferase family 2 protein [Sphingobacterium faecium]|uniref:glycosyltransferase family 2 protein n=1 Tax=Sphingobacterium faecium TaxID=34087 RepID=UPI003209FE76
MQDQKPIVSIIVPVYNAADTVHIAFDSLYKQTYPNLEIIIVNDASTDNSLHIIQEHAKKLVEHRQYTVRIVSHETNGGVAQARNTALDQATGEYIYYLDADDQIDPDTMTLVVDQALKTQSDIVGFNWWLTFSKNERKMNQPAFNDPWQAIQLLLNGKMRWNLWIFLVKRSLYEENGIRFIPQMNMGEDMMVTIKLFSCAKKVSYLDQALYHYGQSNADSVSKVISDKNIYEVTQNVAEVEHFLRHSQYADRIGNRLELLKLNIKLPLLISNSTAQYKKWLAWFPESNVFAFQDKNISLRIRILQFCAIKKNYWLIKLHYYLVIRMIYGLIYK